MASTLNENNLEKKFQSVTNTQDGIQSLSLWILHHKVHHKKIVEMWMKVLKKAKPSHRLTLLYLANDVVQNSRKKAGSHFGESFAEVLKEACVLLRDEKIQTSVKRVFKIWEERSVYDPDFINELYDMLEGSKESPPVSSKIIADFKPQKVADQIRMVDKIAKETLTKLAMLTNSKVDAASSEALRKLKDRKHGQQFSRDFDTSVKCLEDYIRALEKEVKERTELILVLEQGGAYYETQRGEARLVTNAYRNFGNRVKALKKKLEEVTPTLPSPIPSPCPDAPSPTNSEEGFELLTQQDKAELQEPASVGSAPSPENSPVVPALSPLNSGANPVANLPLESTGLSSFMSKGSEMISLLGTLKSDSSASQSTTAEPTYPDPKITHSSLESHLSNLSNIIQNTIFGSQEKRGFSTPFYGSSTTNSPPPQSFDLASGGSSVHEAPDTGSGTPLKDEGSGRETPVQDEGESSSVSLKQPVGNYHVDSADKFFKALAEQKHTVPDFTGLATSNTWFIDSRSNPSKNNQTPSSTAVSYKSSNWLPRKETRDNSDSSRYANDDIKECNQENKGPSVTDFFQNISLSHLGNTLNSQQRTTGDNLVFPHIQASRTSDMLKDQRKSDIPTLSVSSQDKTGVKVEMERIGQSVEDLEPQDMDLDESDDESATPVPQKACGRQNDEKTPQQLLEYSNAKEELGISYAKDKNSLCTQSSINSGRRIEQEPNMSAEFGINKIKPVCLDESVCNSPKSKAGMIDVRHDPQNSFTSKLSSTVPLHSTQESVDIGSFSPHNKMDRNVSASKTVEKSVVTSESKTISSLTDKISAATSVGDILKTLSSAFLEGSIKNNLPGKTDKKEQQTSSPIPIVETVHSTSTTEQHDMSHVPDELYSVSRIQTVKPLISVSTEEDKYTCRDYTEGEQPSLGSVGLKQPDVTTQREEYMRDDHYFDSDDRQQTSTIPTLYSRRPLQHNYDNVPALETSSGNYESGSRIQTIQSYRQDRGSVSDRPRWEEEPMVIPPRAVERYEYRQDYYDHKDRYHAHNDYYARRPHHHHNSYVERPGWEAREVSDYYGSPPPKRYPPLMRDRRYQFYPY
ncbi:uncharacterized protein LOC143241058 [Tachypleus tridentatus]|uniref:uncharacterized protein LOC143241058 n=1 Tax=Tachypleus tridentatus TaxID=6853 RepID=UPI003FCEE904